MILYNFETEFTLENTEIITKWINKTVKKEGCTLEEVSYIFCNDAYLLKKNIKYLNHDTLTDIISFDYSVGSIISGDIFISIDRVKDNAHSYSIGFVEELHRVIIHGILHYCGYKDKTAKEKEEMRTKENYYLSLLKTK